MLRIQYSFCKLQRILVSHVHMTNVFEINRRFECRFTVDLHEAQNGFVSFSSEKSFCQIANVGRAFLALFSFLPVLVDSKAKRISQNVVHKR